MKLDEADKILLQIINEKTVYGMSSQFDCDEVGPPAKKKKEDDYEEFEYIPNEVQNEVVSCKTLFCSSSKHDNKVHNNYTYCITSNFELDCQKAIN